MNVRRIARYGSNLALGALVVLTAPGCGTEDAGPEVCEPPPVSDYADLSLTPRAEPEIEAIIMQCSDGLVADQALYELVRQDIAAIRAADPRMADIAFYERARYENPSLSLNAESVAIGEAIVAGTHPSTTCLEEYLGGVGVPGSQRDTWLSMQFEGVLDGRVLAWVYGAARGVAEAQEDAIGGDGSRIYTTAQEYMEGPRDYLFDERGGDCPAGCTTSHLYWWRVGIEAEPVLLADWQARGETTEPAPDTFDFDRFVCAKCPDGRVAETLVETACGDGVDDDCDGDVDCADDDCYQLGPCAAEICDNGADDDGDGAVDCDDESCEYDVACGATACASPPDRAWFFDEPSTPVTQAIRSAMACEQDPGGAAVDACVAASITELSAPCASCVGDMAVCGLEACRDACGGLDEPCIRCVEDACSEDLAACAGLEFTWR